MNTGHNIPPEWRRHVDSAYQQGHVDAQAQYHKAGPPQQYVYVERNGQTHKPNGNGNGARPSMIEGLNANVMTVVSVIFFVAWATYFGTTQFQTLQNGQERTENKIAQTTAEIKNIVSTYAANTSDRIQRLEDEVRSRTASRVSKGDLEIWCAKTERLNADIKWRCGPVINQLTHTMPPIWEGVTDPSLSTATTELPRGGSVQ